MTIANANRTVPLFPYDGGDVCLLEAHVRPGAGRVWLFGLHVWMEEWQVEVG